MPDPNFDTLRERLRERVMESGYDGGYCPSCSVQLTSADREAEECTNCGEVLAFDEGDESADEDLWD